MIRYLGLYFVPPSLPILKKYTSCSLEALSPNSVRDLPAMKNDLSLLAPSAIFSFESARESSIYIGRLFDT